MPVNSEEPCARCASLSMRQALLDWAPVLLVFIDVLQAVR